MLKDIVERPSKPPSAPSAPSLSPGNTGFPTAVHRSQRPSAFAKARQQQAARQAGEKAVGEGKAVDVIPSLVTSQPRQDANGGESSKLSEMEEVRRSVEAENVRRVEGMSNVEREEEVEELKERFGNGIMDLMRKRKEARENKSSNDIEGSSKDVNPTGLNESGPSTRPLELTDAQKILDQVSEENRMKVESMNSLEREQEVEELQERFGGKLMDALRRRAEARVGKGKGRERGNESQNQTIEKPASISPPQRSKPQPRLQTDDPSLSELKTYFPSVPTESSKLAWLQPLPPSDASSSYTTASSPRFDLSGNLLSTSEQNDLPSHLGLHHHGSSPDLAGYTISEVLYLCRSTVPSQKITMMNLLTKILVKFNNDEYEEENVLKEFQENQMVKRAIEIGVEILLGLSRGLGVIQSGIDLLFEALKGPSWTWINDEEKQIDAMRFTLDENEDIGISATIPFEDILPRLKELLSIEDGLSSQTIYQLITILRRSTLISRELCEIICPIIPALIKAHVISRPWPPKSADTQSYPNLEALKLLRDITTSSRACAEDLLGQGIYETTLRFVVTATWENGDTDSDIKQHGQHLALEVLRTYSVLGRYGLSSNIVTSSSEIWRLLGGWVNQNSAKESLCTIEKQIIESYFNLLEIWITCAIDPHRTTPEHDLTWAQVSAMKWEDEAISIIQKTKDDVQLAAPLEMLCAWAKGVKINGVKGGEEERNHLLVSLQERQLHQHIEAIIRDRDQDVSNTRTLAAAVQLHRLLQPSGQLLSAKIIEELRTEYLTTPTPENRYVTHLRYEMLLLSVSTPLSTEWISNAFKLFQSFQIGDEPLALESLDIILKSDLSNLIPEIKDINHSDGLQLLRPLLQYQLLPNVESVVAPVQPSHLYLKATSSIRSPAPIGNDEKPALPGLPLGEDWIFSPLNELLRSGTSEALQQAPPDWQASELQIVQSTLLLAKLYYSDVGGDGKKKKVNGLDRARILFNLMKIHMLEHGQTTSNAVNEVEVFRDSLVAELMKGFMDLLVIPRGTDKVQENGEDNNEAEIIPGCALEKISLPFLGSGVPFYQFYQDFLDLYESISFSDKLFTQLLLPVLTMDYPRDYRKLIWVDHFTLLKNIRTRLNQIPILDDSKGLRGYFEPLENDLEILTFYARALVTKYVDRERNEFLWTVAVDHLSGLFWSSTSPTPTTLNDRNEDQEKQEEKQATREEENEKERNSVKIKLKLLIMILSNGSEELIKSILNWNFDPNTNKIDSQVEIEDTEKQRRKDIVMELTGEKGLKRIENL